MEEEIKVEELTPMGVKSRKEIVKVKDSQNLEGFMPWSHEIPENMKIKKRNKFKPSKA